MSENNQPLSIPQKDLDDLKARMNLKMLNMTECAVDSMSNLIHRLESIDNAIAMKINLDEASPRELFDYFNQVKESFKVRQEFLKTLSGHDVDTTKVQVDKADEVVETDISPEDAERIKAEILKRGPKAETPVQDAEIVK